jgi:hypothetical protein
MRLLNGRPEVYKITRLQIVESHDMTPIGQKAVAEM